MSHVAALAAKVLHVRISNVLHHSTLKLSLKIYVLLFSNKFITHLTVDRYMDDMVLESIMIFIKKEYDVFDRF